MRKVIKNGYFDIHSHILFGVDDGPKDKETSLQMIDIAYKDGIRVIMATPHYHPEKCMMEYQVILNKFNEFKEVVKGIHPDMTLYLGREIYYTSDVLEILEGGERLTMHGGKYMLVEYSPMADFNYIKTSINNIMHSGLIPLIAHVERYMCLIEDTDRIEELREMGAAIQVNAASIMGTAGKEIKKIAKSLLRDQMVDVVATDAHSAGTRSPKLEKCVSYMVRKYGLEYTEDLLIYNPQRIIEGKYLEELN